ncbi:thioesterase [Histomonas meleagridis]|uniref:thioesterase n=1 Tax=Histomonas meleagridis TaxID=135588 RepID=UPI0035594364|nr:thioesterase [Histomonas meleagridis]KAH0804737.1 thioesterase [Histomonas meleagridis]
MSGSVGKASLVVGAEHLAPAMKTGVAKVLSTAIMAALMEEASCNAIELSDLSKEKITVGVALELKHKRPSAIGAHITAISRLVDVQQNRLSFEIEAFDEAGLIGTATHQRAFVNQELFERKCYETARKALNK